MTTTNEDEECLLRACMQGNLKVVKRNVEDKGVSVNYCNVDGATMLMSASYYGHLQVVMFLIEKGADPNLQTGTGGTALHFAIFPHNGNVMDTIEVMQCLIDNGADIDASELIGSSPLLLASGKPNASVVQLLVDNGANVNARMTDCDGWDGMTPLHNASKWGYMDNAVVIMTRGADLWKILAERLH
jgi:ankyrin repeat protein